MVRFAKKEGNTVKTNEYEEGEWTGCSYTYIRELDLSKNYISELYCRQFCNKMFHFGCDWDRRCSEHNNQPINSVVRECPRFNNAKKIAEELRHKILTDDDFADFCKIKNAHTHLNRKGDLETFLGIFNTR